MSTPLATLNQQIVSDIDSLADFWKSAAAVEYSVPQAQPAKRKRGPRRRTKTPPPAASV